MDGYERAAGILKAAAHPVRLQILQVLEQEGNACVCHLEKRLGQRQAYISQQLAVLREAGLVIDQRDGLNVFYSTRTGHIGPLLEAAEVVAAAVSDQADPLDFGAVKSVDPADCGCPSCEHELALSAAK
jgi:DNA-binding transcriptional ArsR family regulator